VNYPFNINKFYEFYEFLLGSGSTVQPP